VKPFRENFNSSYAFRLDEVIRKKLYNANRKNLNYIDLGDYEELKTQLECKSIINRRFKMEMLKIAIEEFNNATKDMQIIKMEEIKEGKKIKNVRCHLNQINVDAIIDYIYVKIKTLLFMSKDEIKSIKGFKHTVKFKLWNDKEIFYGKKMEYWRELAQKELAYLKLVINAVAYLTNKGIKMTFNGLTYRIYENEKVIKGVTDINKSLKYVKGVVEENSFTLEEFEDLVLYKGNVLNHKKNDIEMLKDIEDKNTEVFTCNSGNNSNFDTFIKIVNDGSLIESIKLSKEIDEALNQLSN
jgi:hypothetical protein